VYGSDKAMESPQESYAADASRIMRKLIVAGTARLQAECDFVGYPVAHINVQNPTNQLNVSYIERVTPHPYQPSQLVARGNGVPPGGNVLQVNGPQAGQPWNLPSPNPPSQLLPWCFCRTFTNTRVLSEPEVDAADLGTGSFIEMTGEWRSLDWEICQDAATLGGTGAQDYLLPGAVAGNANNYPLLGLPDEAQFQRYISRYYQDAGKFLKLPAGVMQFAGGAGTAFPFDVNQIIPSQDVGQVIFEPRVRFTYVWHEIPASCVPWDTLSAIEGCVNSLPFDPYRFQGGLAPETVLYTGWDVKQGKSADGQVVFDVYTKYTYLPNRDFGSVVNSADVPANYTTTVYPTGPLPRGWNWRLRKLTTPYGLGGNGIGPFIAYDYRPVTTIGAASAAGAPRLLIGGVAAGPNAQAPAGGGKFVVENNLQQPGVQGGGANGQPPYQLADLNQLFRPPQPANGAALVVR
jgi:hypothetical protein